MDQFKSGDYVRVIRTTFSDEKWQKIGEILAEFNVGDILVVNYVSDRHKSMSFKLPNGHLSGNYPLIGFELAYRPGEFYIANCNPGKSTREEYIMRLRNVVKIGSQLGFDAEYFNLLRCSQNKCIGGRFTNIVRVATHNEVEKYFKNDVNPIKDNSIPEYVECIKNDEPIHNHGVVGGIYKVKDWNYSPTDCMIEGSVNGSSSKKRFKPSTKEAYDRYQLVQEAKRRYPVGTKFRPAHISNSDTAWCMITEDSEIKISADGQYIYAYVRNLEFFLDSADPKYGNTSYNRYLYENGKWAEILDSTKEETQKPEPRFRVGDYCKFTNNENIWWYLTDSCDNWYTENALVLSHTPVVEKKESEPQKLIVGNWYTTKSTVKDTWLVKYSHTDKNGLIWHFKCTCITDGYKSLTEGHLNKKDVNSYNLLTNLTEVYKYFPEEEPKSDEYQSYRYQVIDFGNVLTGELKHCKTINHSKVLSEPKLILKAKKSENKRKLIIINK